MIDDFRLCPSLQIHIFSFFSTKHTSQWKIKLQPFIVVSVQNIEMDLNLDQDFAEGKLGVLVF